MARGARWRRWVVVAIVAVPLALAGAFFIMGAVLERRLVAEANAILGAPHPRPVHVDAMVPGSFGEALTPHLAAIEKAATAFWEDEPEREALPAVLRGERPLSDLPARVQGDLVRLGGALDGVLRATHAARADYASVEDGFDPSPGTTGVAFQYAAALAAIRIRSAVERGDTVRATADCLDGLALARDEGVAGGLIGRMVGTVIITRLAYACVEALSAAPAAERSAAISRLRTLRDTIPGLDTMMREEAAWMQLMIHAPDLPATRRGELLSRPRLVAEAGRRNPNPLAKRILYRAAWPFTRARYAELIRIAALPAPQRDAALEALGAAASSFTPDPAAWLRYFRRADAAIRELDLVIAGAAAKLHRERQGDWPADCAALAKEGLLTDAEAAHIGAALFHHFVRRDQVLVAMLPERAARR